jgi:hypothetical protein
MKKYFLVVVSAVALLACNGVDKTLLSDIQNNIQSLQSNSAGIESSFNKAKSLSEKLKTASDTTLMDGVYFAEYSNRVSMLVQKCQATKIENDDQIAKLEALKKDYEAGKLKKEELLPEFELLKQNSSGKAALLTRIDSLIGATETDFLNFLSTGKPSDEIKARAGQ